MLEQQGLEAEEAEGRDPSGERSPEPYFLVFGTTPEVDILSLRDFEQHAVVGMESGTAARVVLHPTHT